MLSEEVVRELLTYGLEGIVIIALGFATVHLYRRACALEEDKLVLMGEKMDLALKSQEALREFASTVKLVLVSLRGGGGQ